MSQEKMNSGITAFRDGNREVAKKLFSEIIRSDPSNETAWLWFAASIDDNKQKEFCFSRVLEINPNNENAQKALSQIKKPLSPSFNDLINVSSRPDDASSNNLMSDNRVDIQTLKCPMCGANIRLDERECGYCGSILIVTSIEKTFSGNFDAQLLSTSANKWKSVLLTNPNNPEANYALGLNYLNLKLRDTALQYFQKAASVMPYSAIVHYNLALTLFNDGNILLNSPDYKKVLEAIDYAIRLEPNFKEPNAFKHFFIARKLDNVDYSESIKEYNTAIDICPDIPTFHYNLGVGYYKTKNYGLAEKSYLKAIELDPEYCKAYNSLCALYYSTKKYKEGVHYGRRAIELLRPTTLDNSQAFAYNNLSLCLWKTNQTKEATEMIKKAIAIKPQDPLFQKNLKAYKRINVNIILLVLIIVIIVFFVLYAWLFSNGMLR